MLRLRMLRLRMLRLMFLNDLAGCKSSCCDSRCAAKSQCISREEFELYLCVMHSNYFDSLHRYPLHNDGSLSEEYSDFPPIRVRKSMTPDHHDPSSSEVQSPPQPTKGLRQKNILNTIKVSVRTQLFQQTS
jgi:hypothetical protein